MKFNIIYLILLILITSCKKNDRKEQREHIKSEHQIKETITTNEDEPSKTASQQKKEFFEYRQYLIPFSNKKGVPYFKEENYGKVLEGFDVSSNNYFYFMGGDPATLVCYNKENLVFRKSFSNINAGPIEIIGDTICSFDLFFEKNSLYHFETKGGKILQKFDKITDNHVNSVILRDSILIVDILSGSNNRNSLKKLFFDSRTGKFLQEKSPQTPMVKKDSLDTTDKSFIGFFKEHPIMSKYDFEQDIHKVFTRINSEEVILIKLKKSLIGKDIVGLSPMPIEHKLIHNNGLYILGQKKDNVVIT